jgi:CubicO group peptidase (beta-lactamase class C family)
MTCETLASTLSSAGWPTCADPALLDLSPSRLRRIGSWLDGLVDDGKLAGASVSLMRCGVLAYAKVAGMADIARGLPMAADTLFRIKSMTKPLTAVAALTLYEEGRFQLDDPLSRFLPCFANQRVALGGSPDRIETVPAMREATMRDLLTHTAGLTYGFIGKTATDAMYRAHGVDFQLDSPLRAGSPTASLTDMVKRAAAMPLLAQPGEQWNYSIASDVLGHLVAMLSDTDLPTAMRERVTVPLGMNDTTFTVPTNKLSRFAAHYGTGPDALVLLDDPLSSRFATVPSLHSGGGGLISTAPDYHRFCQMLLNGGVLDGVRLLGRKTVELMTANHLPSDIARAGTPFQEDASHGVGFGLGVSVMLDPVAAQVIGSPGEFGWIGSASTAFWVDPTEDLAVVFLAQLTPDWTLPLRRELRVLVYQALTGPPRTH